MKNLLYIGFLATLDVSLVQSQHHWFWQNPRPTGSELRAVTFFAADTGLAVGLAGTILQTTNRGASWVLQTSISEATNLYDVTALDRQTAVAVGSGERVYRSTDRGSTWYTQNVGSPSVDFSSISFATNTTGIAAGTGRTHRTTDGGLTWFPLSASQDRLNTVSLVTEELGFAARGSEIVRTTTGGATWTQQYYRNNAWFFGVAKRTSNDWFVTGGGYDSLYEDYGIILRSTNAGNTWSMSLMRYPDWLFAIEFVDSANGFAMGERGCFLGTTDGGTTWRELPSTGTITFGTYFHNASAGVAVGGYGTIFTTTNSGANWTLHRESFTDRPVRSVKCLSAFVTIVVTDDGIFRTTNGGQAWSRVSWNGGYGIAFKDDVGMMVSSGIWNSIFYRSSDGGSTWSQQGDVVPWHALNVHMFSRDTALGIGKAIIRTTNSGLSWSTQWNSNVSLRSVAFLNNRDGIAVGDRSTVLRTTDGGLSWSGQSGQPLGCEDPFYDTNLYDVQYVDSTTIFMVAEQAYNGVIFRSTDGGLSWSCLRMPSSLYGVAFTSATTGFIAGVRYLYYTSDAGASWNQSLTPSAVVNDVTFWNHNIGYMVGSNGAVLATTNGGATWASESWNTTNNRPVTRLLRQNYPNPFNSVTTITYDLSRRTNATLKVYDVLGREVVTLTDGMQESGRHQVQFHAGHLASGIYLFRLIADGVLQTGKMVLQK